MKIAQEFRDFISRGNVIDLAVGIVVGAAFTAIVNSLVADIITPILGILMGGINFSGLAITVGEAQITYGNFIQAIINFLIISIAVFLLVRAINMVYRSGEKKAATPPPPPEVQLLTEIRDILKARQPLENQP